MANESKYRLGDEWPTSERGSENAVPMLVCPCDALVEPDSPNCETCGRLFDEKGRRVVGEYDLDEDGDLVPIMQGVE